MKTFQQPDTGWAIVAVDIAKKIFQQPGTGWTIVAVDNAKKTFQQPGTGWTKDCSQTGFIDRIPVNDPIGFAIR